MQEMSRNVSVEDMQFGGLFVVQQDNMVLLSNGPDWVRHPTTQEKVYILSRYVSEQDVKCPSCGEYGRHGLVILEQNWIVVCCKACKQFVWCRVP